MSGNLSKLLSKVLKTPSGCWEWTGFIYPNGYGQTSFSLLDTGRYAHRVSYVLHNQGSVKDRFVCHKCDNRKCVNPDHLFLGDAKVNNLDMQQKGRNKKGKNYITHCRNGHELTVENSYILKDRPRACLTCKREKDRAAQKRLKEKRCQTI
jgi:hypothetical protein